MMAVTPARVVLFLIGLFAAAGLVGYGTGAFGPRDVQPEVASLKAPTSAATNTTPPASATATSPKGEAAVPSSITDEAQPESGSAQPQREASVEANAASDAANSTRSDRVTPSFDVLRVEPDGSTVVAGRAKPGATVEMLSADTVLGQTTVSANGDFAIALDQPLPAGDHTLVLRAKSDGGSATSTEVAIVSVPKNRDGQVLAMVQEPGQPSRLISLPEADKSGQTTAGTNQQAAASAAPTQNQQTATTTPGAASRDASAPATATNQPVAAPGAPQSAPAAQDSKAPTVEAVEIEGSMIYVAGQAAPGAKLRAYANDDFLGEATASPDGQFLVEAKRDLAVGKYTIRIDAIGADGATVTQRAAVPFEREAGEAIAAVASSENSGAPANAGGTAPAAVQAPATVGNPASSGTAAAPTTEPALGASSGEASVAASASAATTAPALQRSNGAVIIRRGDSLWHISKRAYGRGVRYSTIYLANQDQIQNPNRIWPGQIFHMPESTTEGEKADMTRLGEQATTRD